MLEAFRPVHLDRDVALMRTGRVPIHPTAPRVRTGLEHDKAVARKGWAQAQALIEADDHQLIVLDELTYLINWGWIDPEPVYEVIRNRPPKVNVVVTGRDAPQELIDLADTVSEVRKVKHAFDEGILAKKGIDY